MVEDRKGDRRGFPASPSTQRADSDQLVHLATQRLVGDFWIWPHHPEKYRSKFGVRPHQQDCESGEDELEIAPTLEASGVEEAGVEQSLCGHSLRDRLGDDGLSCPGEPVQQMNKGPVKIVRQELNFVQKFPLRQPFRLPCRYSACCTQWKLLRTAASPARDNRSSGPPLRRLK
jgi:hypothetical protein